MKLKNNFYRKVFFLWYKRYLWREWEYLTLQKALAFRLNKCILVRRADGSITRPLRRKVIVRTIAPIWGQLNWQFHEWPVDDFPHFSEDLRSITVGSYQLRQVRSYYAEHIKINGSYVIDVCKHTGDLSLSSHGLSVGDPLLIRGRIQSRHRSSTRYFIYILIDKAVQVDEEKDGVDSISGYSCTCPNGLWTVSCCAHVATVLWYLGFGRHQFEILIPA